MIRFPCIQKSVQSVFLLSTSLFLINTVTHADMLSCDQSSVRHSGKICAARYVKTRQQLKTQYLTALLISDAPTKLLEDSQKLWQNRLQRCTTHLCRKQQFEARIEELNVYTSLNQNLTQHFFKIEQGQLANPATQLQIQQLSKTQIKIEGIAFRNPNNRLEKQSYLFQAYSSNDKKQDVLNIESQCRYQIDYEKAFIQLKSQSQRKICSHFQGIYRLYD